MLKVMAEYTSYDANSKSGNQARLSTHIRLSDFRGDGDAGEPLGRRRAVVGVFQACAMTIGYGQRPSLVLVHAKNHMALS